MEIDKTDSRLLELCQLMLAQLSDPEFRGERIEQTLRLKFEAKMSLDDYIQYQFFGALSQMYHAGFQDGKSLVLPEVISLISEKQTKLYYAARKNVRSNSADQFAIKMAPFIQQIRGTGRITLQEVADKLNQMGLQTPNGGQWLPGSVRSLESRLENIKAKSQRFEDQLKG